MLLTVILSFLFFSEALENFPAFAGPETPAGEGLPVLIPLFSLNFTSYDNVNFTIYRPNIKTASKIRYVMKCSLPPGRQFDRSIYVVVENALIFAGTTAEPNKNSPGPSWEVEADLTFSFTALFLNQNLTLLHGYVNLGTLVDPIYNSTPFCTAWIEFYSGM